MARPLRIEYPFAVYHITSRGNAREKIYQNDNDRILFLDILEHVVEKYNLICHAYCLMGNHYHLLIETPDANLSIGMRQLNGMYTQSFNRIHRRVGHVFQGRFKSIIVDKENYLLELCRYIVLNPLRAGIVKGISEYRWTSYLATCGMIEAPKFLTTKWVLSQFGRQEDKAIKAYREFIKDGVGIKSFEGEIRGNIILGDENFIKKIKSKLEDMKGEEELPREQRMVGRPKIEDVFKGKMNKEIRNDKIKKAHIDYGYRLKEIGNYLGLHYATVSRIANK